MRLAEMVVREDFYTILRNTVIDYYRQVYGQDAVFSYKKSQNCEKLIVNGKMGFISRFPSPSGLRRFLTAEYNIRGSKMKFLTGKVAALLVSTFPQIGKKKNVYLTKGLLGKNTFISPQNRSIRFFDYESMTVDCIIKSGFTNKYFTNQLNFRKKNRYDFMLPLLKSGECWFREPILTGHALARVTDPEVYQKGSQDVLVNIAMLAADTMIYSELQMYTEQLYEKIVRLLLEASHRKSICCAEQTKRLVNMALQWIGNTSMQIPLCMSHGDLQEGNIWVDNTGKTWIYDWETVGQRSIWYDSAVLKYSLRRPYGWEKIFEEKQPQMVCCCDPNKNRSFEEYQIIKGVILLEDILFYLEDMLELPDDWGGALYDAFVGRMEKLLLM